MDKQPDFNHFSSKIIDIIVEEFDYKIVHLDSFSIEKVFICIDKKILFGKYLSDCRATASPRLCPNMGCCAKKEILIYQRCVHCGHSYTHQLNNTNLFKLSECQTYCILKGQDHFLYHAFK